MQKKKSHNLSLELVTFERIIKIRPTFPEYVLSARMGGEKIYYLLYMCKKVGPAEVGPATKLIQAQIQFG